MSYSGVPVSAVTVLLATLRQLTASVATRARATGMARPAAIVHKHTATDGHQALVECNCHAIDPQAQPSALLCFCIPQRPF